MKKGAKDSKEMKNRALASSPKDILELKQAHIITINLKEHHHTKTKERPELKVRCQKDSKESSRKSDI